MKKCSCGSETFLGHQVCRHDVVVSNDGNFEEDRGIYDAGRPYGPFFCTSCGKEYERIPDDLPEDHNQESPNTNVG